MSNFLLQSNSPGSNPTCASVRWVFVVAVCGLIAVVNGPVARAQTAVPAPISYYSFDEAAGSTTLLDGIRGTSGNGTLYGFGRSGGAFVPGLVGNALRFNGSSTYVTTAETANFGSGPINGQVMTLTVAVPEPSSIALAGVGTCLAGLTG
jgi:hypothetical protein